MTPRTDAAVAHGYAVCRPILMQRSAAAGGRFLAQVARDVDHVDPLAQWMDDAAGTSVRRATLAVDDGASSPDNESMCVARTKRPDLRRPPTDRPCRPRIRHGYGRRPHPARPSSTPRSWTRWNSRTSPVTTTLSVASACAAAHRSLGSMGVPRPFQGTARHGVRASLGDPLSDRPSRLVQEPRQDVGIERRARHLRRRVRRALPERCRRRPGTGHRAARGTRATPAPPPARAGGR